MAEKMINSDQHAPDRSLIEFLPDPARAVSREEELDQRRSQPDGAPESKFITAKELLALTRKRGAVLTDADARAIEELKSL